MTVTATLTCASTGSSRSPSGSNSPSSSSCSPCPTSPLPKSACVPLACFGNGRFASGKNVAKVSFEQELFVPSQALEQLIKQMPQVSRPRWGAALLQLGGSLLFLALSLLLLAYSPWFFLPVAWTITGSALSLLFIIGHDCAHNNWSPSPLVNSLVGELSFLFLLQPFESFKLTHNFSHVHDEFEAEEEKDGATPPLPRPFPTNEDGQSLRIEYAHPANTEPLPWWMQQFFTFIQRHFAPKEVADDKKMRVYASIVANVAFTGFVLLQLLLSEGHVLAVFKMWAMPLLAYRACYAGICRLWTLNVRAFLPRDSPHVFNIASYNYALLTRALARSADFGASVRSSSLVSLFKQWKRRINWVNFIILTSVPIIALIGLFTTPLTFKTFAWSMVYYWFSGLGITAGYHRLFAHRAYEANWITRVFLMLAGSAALEGSIKWWCGGHRVHHRFTDTPKDPYNSGGGFFYAHMGWMLIKPDPKNYAKADIRDLNADPLIRAQHTYYLFFGPFMALILPTLVAGLGWGDWWGGYFYAGAFRLFFVHHATFCVNSVAHYFGEHTFDDDRSPRDHIITAFLTFGEGYHNFHHEFPNDYRNGIQWYHYDPTKWLIAALSWLGCTRNLKVFPKNEIRRGVLYMREKKLAALKAAVVQPKGRDQLPTWSWDKYVKAVKEEGACLVVIDNFVHDVTHFLSAHPGGEALLRGYFGQDATKVFYGQTEPVVYKHAHAAHNLLSNMRVATIDPATKPDKKAE